MAAAVSLHLELEVEETGEFSLDPGALAVSTGRDNLVVRAFESLHPVEGIGFRLRSEIPLARGLGSSAAAIVAGLFAADHLFELALSAEEMLARASELEGHPDNVAAAIYGGFVICGAGEGGRPIAARFDPPSGLEAIAVIPTEQVPTELARQAIPAEIPLGDAVANISAASELVLGVCQADLDLIGRGLIDRIHQPRRRELYPRSMELVDLAPELGALGATISGAGPAVLVWTTWQDAGKVTEQLENRCGDWAEVRRLPFTPHGADVPEL
jgi:homoserine kinase